MNVISGEFGKNQKFTNLTQVIENKKDPICISGLTDVGIAQIISAINGFSKKTICIVTYNEIQAKKIINDIQYFTDKVVFSLKRKL